MIDPESQLMQTDWEPLGQWMKRRAEEKGLKDWEVYGHAEELVLDYVIDQMVAEAAVLLGWAAGQSLGEIPDEQGKHCGAEEAPERKPAGDV